MTAHSETVRPARTRQTLVGLLLILGCSGAGSGGDADRIGGCVLTEARGEVPADPYAVGTITAVSDYGMFTRQLTVHGITLIAEESVPDAFLVAVGQTIEEIFATKTAADTQRMLLENLYRYRATVPVFQGEPDFDRIDWGRAEEDSSICDIIMSGVDGQVMEVVEHLLHIITDVGMHHTFPEQWGLTDDSLLAQGMAESLEAGVYDISDYTDLEGDSDRDRILMQEYAYWLITTEWDLQQAHGPDNNTEWSLSSPSEVASQLPLSHQLYLDTAADLMEAPSPAVLDTLAGFAP